MIGGRGGVMILRVSCGLLIFSVLEVMSEWPCETPLKNIAVYEGILNTLLYSPTNHGSGEWKVRPTTDGNNEYSLVANNDQDYENDDQVYPEYAADFAYDYNSGLTIKNATTTAEPGHKISTAGLYYMFCNGGSPIDFRSKVLVVREGPTCLCTWANSQEVNLVCGSIYADSQVSPIRANYTIYIDGTVYANEAPAATSNDEFTSTSTTAIRTVYSASSIYQCVQTFNAPDAPVSYLASNAPELINSVRGLALLHQQRNQHPPLLHRLQLPHQVKTAVRPDNVSRNPEPIIPLFTSNVSSRLSCIQDLTNVVQTTRIDQKTKTFSSSD